MRKSITIMLSPTVNRAVYEWKVFLSRWATIIKKANINNLCVELLSGHKIYFKGETEGQRALRGLHADIISVDDVDKFAMLQVIELYKRLESKGDNPEYLGGELYQGEFENR